MKMNSEKFTKQTFSIQGDSEVSPVAQKDPLRTLVIIKLDSIGSKLPVGTFCLVPRCTLGQVPRGYSSR